jgi:colicin import membrane protein
MATSSEMTVTVPSIIENDLVLPGSNEGLTLSDYVPVLMQYRDINKTLVFEYRDKKGNAAARSHVAKLRRVKAPITDIHKRLKAEYLAITQQMDADKRAALAVVEEMIDHHDKELRIVEAEEKADAERKRIAQEIIDCWDMAHEMNAMVDQQRELDMQAAEQARVAEEQAAEQRRMQIEKEKKEAADKAAEEARLAEQARAARAIEEARQREQAAKEDADRKVKEAVARAEREKAEAEASAKAEEERKRQEEDRANADLENIKRVHWAIIPAMVAQGITEDHAQSLILAIRDGEIPAVSIDYQWKPQG